MAVPYGAKLLADLGADVIKLERPDGGDPSRWRGPQIDGTFDPERSGAFLYLNTSKRSVRLDLASDEGRAALIALARRADVLIEDRPPGELAELGLDYAALARHNPRLIVVSVTPFGQY